ncbi:MAG: sulfide/dihydroorotate dehydrogenase-like FAD/NAD-binding protein [Candidatus Omnitrophota bacterium]
MHKIIEKKILAKGIVFLRVEAPLVVREAKPGQFIIARLDEFAERIPLTICDFDKLARTITLIIQELGRSTKDLCALNPGDNIRDILGPLGNPSEIEKFGTVVMIGGGVGAAELYTVVRALKAKGNKVIAILGARNKDLVILKNEFSGIADEVLVTTDDGSYGIKGLVTGALKKLFERGETINRIICCGPIPMMKAVTETAGPKNITTIVSLNAILLDATGMCGSCRCTVEGKTRFSCVDGPEFDGSKVDFDELLLRNRRFLEEEKRALEE